jgi:hypothetical protein
MGKCKPFFCCNRDLVKGMMVAYRNKGDWKGIWNIGGRKEGSNGTKGIKERKE